jgi:Holliday junction DNA helicase RuvA
VHSGLVGLGYSSKDADEAVSTVEPEAEAEAAAGRVPQVAALLKAALRSLSVR